jgi:16S rRNA (cytidine1402-2'-O)-methyltransferase
LHSEHAVPVKGRLYVVATPIGNLRDVTLRALDVLAEVDVIAAEDTRVSEVLLTQHGIRKRLMALHQHNERAQTERILELLAQGAQVAYLTDAGTPLVSDPGAHLVREARRSGFEAIPIPGPSAVIAALSAIGLESERFLFAGFLPAKPAARRGALAALRGIDCAAVLYEAPHRVRACLADIGAVLGDATATTLAKELTKVHEAIVTGTPAEIAVWLDAEPGRSKGEFVLVIHARPARSGGADLAEAQRVLELLLAELPPTRAAALAAKITGAPRGTLYALATERRRSRP